MRTFLRGLRGRIESRAAAWVRRRQGQDADPVLLHRSRIYILPTRLGLAYAAMVVAMLAGGLNYNNNLGLALGFLLASLGLVAMHHTHANLAGLSLRLAGTKQAHVGQPVAFGVRFENSARTARLRIGLEENEATAPMADVPASGDCEVALRVIARQRGRIDLSRFVVATEHPLGLFRAWAVVHPRYSALAWPVPGPPGRLPSGVATDTGGAQDHARGDEDFAGLKPFQAGDSLRRIAWKAYARGQGLHTKQYAGTDVTSHVFDWDSLAGLDTETRLSQLCRWVLDAHSRGEAFGLRLPGETIPVNLGTAHFERCLDALALFDAEPAHG